MSVRACFRVSASPVGLLLLVLEVSVGLLQLLRHDLEAPRQLVLSLELLTHQHQVPSRVVQRDVRQVQTWNTGGRGTDLKHRRGWVQT